MNTRPLFVVLASLAAATAASTQLTHIPAYPLHGNSEGDVFGTSVRNAGDVNNDGFADLIVGSHLGDINGSGSGTARVFLSHSLLTACAGDADSSGTVNFADITAVLLHFNSACP